MRISIISPNLSQNCLGRAHVLAQILECNYDVEIVGPKLQDSIWKPVANEYNYQSVSSSHRIDQFVLDIPELLELISGEIVYVSKPRLNSYGVGLLKTLSREQPLILDIDDWELGLKYKEKTNFHTYLKGVPMLATPHSFYYTKIFEMLSGLADARTVSNRFLQKRFGGTIIPHARNADKFDPELYDIAEVREELNLPKDDLLVMFSGTPRPHKGVDILAKSISKIDSSNIKAVIVGADNSDYIRKIKSIAGDSILIRGKQPFDEIPKWIAAANIITIPQRKTYQTKGQLPAKVFDAMAMKKPIISTNVSDLPYILDDCGIIIKPDDPNMLADRIVKLSEDREQMNDLGDSARKKYLENYSLDALAPVLDDVVHSVTKEF